jgi:DNA segregation ATPase FtsK/SpoIIIE-like protein
MSGTRRTSRPRVTGRRTPVAARRPVRRRTRPLLTPEQSRDVGGVLLVGGSLLCLAALIVHGAPLLDGLRAFLLGAVGYGWPLVLGSVIVAGVLMIWPAPQAATPPAKSKVQLDDDEGGEDHEPSKPAPRRFQPRPPSGLEATAAAVGMLAMLGILNLAHTPAGGAVGRFGLWLVSPAGAGGGLLILLLVVVLAAIVVVRLSPGRTGRAAVVTVRAAYTGRARAIGPLSRLGARIAGQVAELLQALRRPGQASTEPEETPAAAVSPTAQAEVGERRLAPVAVLAGSATGDATSISTPAVAGGDVLEPDHDIDLEADGLEDDGDVQEAEADRPPTQWKLPELDLLDTVEAPAARSRTETERVVKLIVRTLANFGVEVEVVGVNSGPAVTRYALQPAAGVKVSKVVSLQNDLALALGGVALLIEAPIPGQSAIGIQVPNKTSTLVTIGEVVRSAAFKRALVLAVVLGKDVAGRATAGDLTLMPHLLIAGATGQGKSVCINAMVCSLLLRLDPSQLLLVMIDPKRVELQGYNGLPHLAVPVIVDPQQAAAALRWAVGEMESRYKVLAAAGVRNIAGYNAKMQAAGESALPYVVIVIDELADLMMVAAGEIEELVCRIAQLARAVGIHLVIATQRPSTDIITGLIKANVPSRIAFAVGSQVDSRVILDHVGAEKLLGRGDMLYQPVDASRPGRLQGAFISDREVESLVAFWRAQGGPRHLDGVLDAAPLSHAAEEREERELDPLFARAARAVAAEGMASVSLVQRKFNVGYSRAGRVVDQLAEHRVIGAYQGSKAREVLMNLPDVDELLELLALEG